MEKVYIVIHHEFDGEWYHDEIVGVYKDKESAEQYVKDNKGKDLEIEIHDVE